MICDISKKGSSNVKLVVGILRTEPGWTILLEQIGVLWRQIDPDHPVLKDSYSVVIVNAEPTSFQQRDILQFLKDGGSILSAYGNGRSFLGGSISRKRYTYLTPGACGPFAPGSLLDIYQSGKTEHRTGFGQPEMSAEGFSVYRVGDGTVVTIPFDVDSLIRDTRTSRKNFFAPRYRLPSEIVSRVSKGELRQYVTSILEFLHKRRVLPFVHKWYYPDGSPTVFTFRVDSDRGTQEEIDQLYAMCERNRIATTWFLDTQSHETWLSRFRSFKNQEVGIHCYQHTTDTDLERNKANFSKAAALMRSAGLKPAGAAAPFGTWNESIQLVFENLDIRYSSEFSLAYDDLPFFPYRKEGFSPLMQIPIHPICIGSLRGSRFSPEQMKDYFLMITAAKIATNEPICFYHHPTHHHWNVLEDVFGFLRERKIPNLSYSQFASWWTTRAETSAEIEFDPGTQRLTIHGRGAKALQWHVVAPDNTEAFLSPGGSVDLASLTRKGRPSRPEPPANLSRIRAFDIRHLILAFLHLWYRWTQ
jgi:hypothetical protein